MRNAILKILPIVLSVLCLLAACSGGESGKYYVRVDSSCMEPGRARNGVIDFTGGMAYRYTLTGYSALGKEKELSFGASRELRDGAFLCLTVAPVRGVVSWEEVDYEDLPQAVQAKFPQTDTAQ